MTAKKRKSAAIERLLGNRQPAEEPTAAQIVSRVAGEMSRSPQSDPVDALRAAAEAGLKELERQQTHAHHHVAQIALPQVQLAAADDEPPLPRDRQVICDEPAYELVYYRLDTTSYVAVVAKDDPIDSVHATLDDRALSIAHEGQARDLFEIPLGAPHAICGGLLAVTLQTASDSHEITVTLSAASINDERTSER
jgi:hypothetical protein